MELRQSAQQRPQGAAQVTEQLTQFSSAGILFATAGSG